MKGHRTYLDNPRIVIVKTWRPPVPKGHRAFIEPKRRADRSPALWIGDAPKRLWRR